MQPAVQPIDPVQQAPRPAANANDAKIKAAAKQFEAMFMTEMIRQARPPSHAAGPFAEGQGEKSWQIFMDQALGDAAASGDTSGLSGEIAKAMRAAQGHRSK